MSFEKLLEQEHYFRLYLNSLATRNAYSSLQFEKPEIDLTSSITALDIMNFDLACRNLFEKKGDSSRIYPSTIQDINSIINRGKGLTNGYRKVGVITGLNFEAIDANKIPNAMMILLDNYYKIWSALSPYEKEARLHLGIVRIQPFEDGNKRTASIITNYNLVNSLCAPIIIDKEHTSTYLKCIENDDWEALAKLFEKLSQRELHFIIEMYDNIESIEGTEQVIVHNSRKE